MTGLELLRKLPADGHDLPAIMITGESDVAIAVAAMRTGATDFIEKPIGREELIASIYRALEHSRIRTRRWSGENRPRPIWRALRRAKSK